MVRLSAPVRFVPIKVERAGLHTQPIRPQDSYEIWGERLRYLPLQSSTIYEERNQGKTRTYHRYDTSSTSAKFIRCLFYTITLPLHIIPTLIGMTLLQFSKSHKTALAAYNKRNLKFDVKIDPKPVKFSSSKCRHLNKEEFDDLKNHINKYWHTLKPNAKIFTSNDGYVSLQPIGTKTVRVGLPPKITESKNGTKAAKAQFFDLTLDTYLPERPLNPPLNQWKIDRVITQIIARHSLERINFNAISKDLFQHSLKATNGKIKLENSVRINQPYIKNDSAAAVFFRSSIDGSSFIEYFDAQKDSKVEVQLNPNLTTSEIKTEIRKTQLKAIAATLEGYFPFIEAQGQQQAEQHGFTLELVPDPDHPEAPPSKFSLKIGDGSYEKIYSFDDPRLKRERNELTQDLLDYVDELKKDSLDSLKELSEEIQIPFFGESTNSPHSLHFIVKESKYPIKVLLYDNNRQEKIAKFIFRSASKTAFANELIKFKEYQELAEKFANEKGLYIKPTLNTENGLKAELTFTNPFNNNTAVFDIKDTDSLLERYNSCEEQYNELAALSQTLADIRSSIHDYRIEVSVDKDCKQITISYVEVPARYVYNPATYANDEIPEVRITLKSNSLKHESTINPIKIAKRHLQFIEQREIYLLSNIKQFQSDFSDATVDNFPKAPGSKLPNPSRTYSFYNNEEYLNGMARFNIKDGSIDFFSYDFVNNCVNKKTFDEDIHVHQTLPLMLQEQQNSYQALQAALPAVIKNLNLKGSTETILNQYIRKGAIDFQVHSPLTNRNYKGAVLNLTSTGFNFDKFQEKLVKRENKLAQIAQNINDPILKRILEQAPLSYTDIFEPTVALRNGQTIVLQFSPDFRRITVHSHSTKKNEWQSIETDFNTLPFHLRAAQLKNSEEKRFKLSPNWKAISGETYPLLNRSEINKIDYNKLLVLFDKFFPNPTETEHTLKDNISKMLKNIDNSAISNLDAIGAIRVWSMLAFVLKQLEALESSNDKELIVIKSQSLISLGEKASACSGGYAEGAFAAVQILDTNSQKTDARGIFAACKYKYIENLVQKHALGALGDNQNVHTAPKVRAELAKRGYALNDFGKFEEYYSRCGQEAKPYVDAIEKEINLSDFVSRIYDEMLQNIKKSKDSYYHTVIVDMLSGHLRTELQRAPKNYPLLNANFEQLRQIRDRQFAELAVKEKTMDDKEKTNVEALKRNIQNTYITDQTVALNQEIERKGWSHIESDEDMFNYQLTFFGREAVIALLEAEGFITKT